MRLVGSAGLAGSAVGTVTFVDADEVMIWAVVSLSSLSPTNMAPEAPLDETTPLASALELNMT